MNVSVKKTHREWRREVKKFRRKRIRQTLARARDAEQALKEKSPTYLTNLAKERLLEEHEFEENERVRRERNEQWLKDEEEAQTKWKEHQRLKLLSQEQKLKEQQRIKAEWEKQQMIFKKQREEAERLKKEEQQRQEETLRRINSFIEDGGEIPVELKVKRESNPGKELCQFFMKVGACRFGNHCSRNHVHPGISTVLLFPGFYTHFTLQQKKSSEYDTDINLEFEESDTYLHFKEFYNDVVPEFKAHGYVTMVKVCCNAEFHLRGNVYVEYRTEREALVSYKAFQGRWYGGKQLNVEFVKIARWPAAVCGDFARKKCIKGSSCNFLHVFINPRNEFAIDWSRREQSSIRSEGMRSARSHHDRHWRWSETPEPFNNGNSSRSLSHQSQDRSERRRSMDKRCRSKERRSRSRDRSHKNIERRNESSDRREKRHKNNNHERRERSDEQKERSKMRKREEKCEEK